MARVAGVHPGGGPARQGYPAAPQNADAGFSGNGVRGGTLSRNGKRAAIYLNSRNGSSHSLAAPQELAAEAVEGGVKTTAWYAMRRNELLTSPKASPKRSKPLKI
jgi:hypothetical protein